ncbi:hypothetical protein [Streptacidiphilus monticola]|uniref:DUF4352 domain-containing protein n=1 Tax=Streptacidiphilus monticola TaxID=2161674 RepID=A0ABW1G6K6_9ACTN
MRRTAILLALGALLAGAPAALGPVPTATAAGCAAVRALAAPVATPAAALSLPPQAPLGLWTRARLTLRQSGTVRLAVRTRGFSTVSLALQRWTGTHWADLPAGHPDGFPTSDTFSFSAPRGAVALRLKDVDRPGSLRITPSVDRASGPTAATRVTRPAVRLQGWPRQAALRRGGAPLVFTLTVHNTTDRRYPDVGVLFYASAQSGETYLTARELTLEQLVGGRWIRLPLASGCDPGLAVALRPLSGRSLAPGATAGYRLRLRLAAATPAVLRQADAGLALSVDGDDFASLSLPFTLR